LRQCIKVLFYVRKPGLDLSRVELPRVWSPNICNAGMVFEIPLRLCSDTSFNTCKEFKMLRIEWVGGEFWAVARLVGVGQSVDESIISWCDFKGFP